MGNHHFANVGDVMKHLALVRVVELMRPTRYLESHAGAFEYPLAMRDEPLPDGVWDFLARAPVVATLDQSGYAALLRAHAGDRSAPGTYPGSARCVWETLGASTEYILNDTNATAAASLDAALSPRGATATVTEIDGIDLVLDEARPGDLVLIDPFHPDERSPAHGRTATEAFDELVERGIAVALWRALAVVPQRVALGIRRFDVAIGLAFDEPIGSMDGCEFVIANVPADLAADVAGLALAHGAVLTNGEVRIASRRRDRGVRAVREKSSRYGESQVGELIAVGVDGCRAGWVAVMAFEGAPLEFRIFGSIGELVGAARKSGSTPVIAVDMPIGLPASPGHRPCDKAARERLKSPDKDRSRLRSVFPVPDRGLLAQPEFEDVQRIVAERKAIDVAAKGISQQSFYIAQKIAEVDDFVRATPGCEEWLVEVHPEVCFREMSGEGGPILYKGTGAGRTERITLLTGSLAGLDVAVPDPIPRVAGAKRDDVLDALAGLWTALRHRVGLTTELGGERDEHGVVMRMVV